jgi:hypothetical protein
MNCLYQNELVFVKTGKAAFAENVAPASHTAFLYYFSFNGYFLQAV